MFHEETKHTEHLRKTRQLASWLEETRSQCLLETLELKERYFMLGNMNCLVCNQVLPLLSPPV